MSAPFSPVPDGPLPSPQIGGTFFGVRLPRTVPFFDCRWVGHEEPRSPRTGLILWGTERAEFALGNLYAGLRSAHAHPAGVQTPYDSTEPRNADRVAEDVRRLRGMLARVWRDYRAAGRNPAAPGEGGGVVHRPSAIALTNYGATILADLTTARTYSLDNPKRRHRRRHPSGSSRRSRHFPP